MTFHREEKHDPAITVLETLKLNTDYGPLRQDRQLTRNEAMQKYSFFYKSRESDKSYYNQTAYEKIETEMKRHSSVGLRDRLANTKQKRDSSENLLQEPDRKHSLTH